MKKSAQQLVEQQRELAARATKAREQADRAKIQALYKALETERERSGLLAAMAEFSRELPAIKGPKPGSVRATDRRVATAVACASDWHVEEIVDPRKVQGMNKYNPEIARQRARRFFEGVEWLIREQSGIFAINNLVLWLGGDFISGYIHEELVEANAMSPTRAMLFAQELLTQGIDYLLETLPDIKLLIPCNFGNHGRTTLKRRIATACDNSYEWLLYNQLATHYSKNERVTFSVCEGLHQVVQIYDLRIHMHHGDDVRSLGGIGGVQVPLQRACIQWHRKFKAHMSIVGHFHEYNSGELFVMNGSLIGYGMYSDSLPGAQNKPATQAFFLVDSKRGKTQCAPLWVAER